MSGQVIAVVGVKGGCGKSTIAAHLVSWVARQGRTVGVVDSDPQQAVSRWLGEAMPDVETVTALSSDDVLEAIPELASRFSCVLADGPGGESEATRALMLRAALVILPCGPSVLDLRALRETAHLVKQARSIRNGQPDAVVALNRQQPRTRVSREVIAAAPALGLRVAKSIVHQRAAIADSVGQGVFAWDMGAPARSAAIEIESLFNEVFEHVSKKETADRGGSGGRAGIHREDDSGSTQESSTQEI